MDRKIEDISVKQARQNANTNWILVAVNFILFGLLFSSFPAQLFGIWIVLICLILR